MIVLEVTKRVQIEQIRKYKLMFIRHDSRLTKGFASPPKSN